MGVACVRIRPLQDGETAPVLAVFAGLQARSRELRFLTPKVRLTPDELRELSRIDGRDRVALVAELDDGRPVGIARFVRYAGDVTVADVAVAIIDSWQRRGIGIRLAQELADHARSVCVRRFTAHILPENEGSLRLMHHVGGGVRPVESDAHSAEFEITLPDPAAPSISMVSETTRISSRT